METGQNSRRDIWPQGADPKGQSWGLNLQFNQALQRPAQFPFLSPVSQSALFPCVTFALGTCTVRLTNPGAWQEKNIRPGVS